MPITSTTVSARLRRTVRVQNVDKPHSLVTCLHIHFSCYVDESGLLVLISPLMSLLLLAGPIKALVQERQTDWQARFGQLGLKVIQLTGDDDADGQEDMEAADIICSTPEKFGEHTTLYWHCTSSLCASLMTACHEWCVLSLDMCLHADTGHASAHIVSRILSQR